MARRDLASEGAPPAPTTRMAIIRRRVRRFIRQRPFSAFLIVLAVTFAGTLGTVSAVGVWPGNVVYGNGVYATRLAVDASGSFHVLFTNTSLVYATNVGGGWTTRILDTNWSYAPSIAVDSKGHLHVLEDVFNTSILSHNVGPVRYFTNAGGSWTETTITEQGASASMTLDRADAVHIVYLWSSPTSTVNRSTDIHYVTQAGGTWTDRVVFTSPYDLTTTSATAVAASVSGKVAITVSEGVYALGYLTNEPGSWNFTWLLLGLSSGGVYGPVPVAIDSAGNAHLTYAAYNVSTNTTTVVHAKESDGRWSLEPVARVGGPIACSMVLDASDHVHIAYSDSRTGATMYTTNLHGAWSPRLVDPQSGIYQTPSLALLASGEPVIAYTAVRPPPWGSMLGQEFIRVASASLGWWNLPDLFAEAAPYLTIELFAVAVVVWVLADPSRIRHR